MTRNTEFLKLVDKNIGNKIRDTRVFQGKSREWLSGQIQVSGEQLRKYEDGRNRICPGRLAMVARALKVDVAFFFSEVSLATPSPSRHERKRMEIAKSLKGIKDYDLLVRIGEQISKIEKFVNEEL